MRKLSLTEWAAIAEIVGTAAVVVSLLFVAYSINHNSAVIQSSNEDFLYELQHARLREIISSRELASAYAKQDGGEELTDVEQEMFFWDGVIELSTWEIAFIRQRDGQFSPKQWEAWDHYFIVGFVTRFPAKSWARVRDFFSVDFRYHVDAIYARTQ